MAGQLTQGSSSPVPGPSLRIMEVPDKPQEAILKVGFSDGIYGRSKGGMTFSGWKCEHLPYLVEIDNWGVSKQPGQAKVGGIWIWGWLLSLFQGSRKATLRPTVKKLIHISKERASLVPMPERGVAMSAGAATPRGPDGPPG